MPPETKNTVNELIRIYLLEHGIIAGGSTTALPWDLLFIVIGSTYYAVTPAGVTASGSTFSTVWNTAIGLLPSRTRKYKVSCIGNFTVTALCNLDSYLSIDWTAATFTRAAIGYHMWLGLSETQIDITGGIINSMNDTMENYDSNEIRLDACTYCTIDNVTVNDAADSCIRLKDGCSDIKVTRCSIYNAKRHAILVVGNGPHNITIADNFVDTIGVYDGITLYMTDGHTISIVGNTVQNVDGSAVSSAAIQLEEIGVAPDDNNVSCTGNTIYNCQYGIGVASSMRPVTVTGNAIRKCQRGIFLQNSGRSVVSSNMINNTEMTATNYGIYVYGIQNGVISSNSFEGAAAYTIGIYHDGSGSYKSCTISNNAFMTCLNAISGVGLHSTYTGNTIRECNQTAIIIPTGDHYCTFIGNTFMNNGAQTDATYYDFDVGGSAMANMFGHTFVGNQSINDASNRVNYHINFSSAANTNNITIAAMRVVGARAGGVNGTPASNYSLWSSTVLGSLVDNPGMVRAISFNDTTSTATVPNTDTNLKTYSLAANVYTSIMIEADVEIVSQGTSTAQAVTIQAKIGTTTKSFTVDVAAAADRQIRHVTIDAAQTGSATIAISHGAPAADANTTTNVFNLYVWGVV